MKGQPPKRKADIYDRISGTHGTPSKRHASLREGSVSVSASSGLVTPSKVPLAATIEAVRERRRRTCSSENISVPKAASSGAVQFLADVQAAAERPRNEAHLDGSSSGRQIRASTSRAQSQYQEFFLDAERLAVRNCHLAPGETLGVRAGPGVGKTEEMLQWLSVHRQYKSLFLVYNKSLEPDVYNRASSKNLSNVTVQTTDSFAWCLTQHIHGGRTLNSTYPQVVRKAIIRSQVVGAGDTVSNASVKVVRDTLASYIASDATRVMQDHCPPMNAQQNSRVLPVADVLRATQYFWDQMINPDNQDFRMEHGSCMKALQLDLDSCLRSYPDLFHYDAYLLDESQDATDATIDVLLHLASKYGKRVLFVGDLHQRVYGFRLGASSVFASHKFTHNLSLTNSLRFGAILAEGATAVIKHLKPMHTCYHLSGNPRKETKIIYLDATQPLPPCDQETCVIARRNVTLFQFLAKHIVCHSERLRIGFIGGLKGYDFDDLLMDLYLLWKNRLEEIKDTRVKRCKTFEAFVSNARGDDNLWDLARAHIVEEFTDQLPKIIGLIKQMTVKSNADLWLSTTHKAKGLTMRSILLLNDFMQVRLKPEDRLLCDDFVQKRIALETALKNRSQKKHFPHEALALVIAFLGIPHAMLTPEWNEEVNIFFVAVTRASHQLHLCPEASALWKQLCVGRVHMIPAFMNEERKAPRRPRIQTPGNGATFSLPPLGTEVFVQGLSRCPQYNGKRGVVTDADVHNGRATIRLTNSSGGQTQCISVKPENIAIRNR